MCFLCHSFLPLRCRHVVSLKQSRMHCLCVLATLSQLPRGISSSEEELSRPSWSAPLGFAAVPMPWFTPLLDAALPFVLGLSATALWASGTSSSDSLPGEWETAVGTAVRCMKGMSSSESDAMTTETAHGALSSSSPGLRSRTALRFQLCHSPRSQEFVVTYGSSMRLDERGKMAALDLQSGRVLSRA